MKNIQEMTKEQTRLSSDIEKFNKAIQKELKSGFISPEYVREKTQAIKSKSNRIYQIELLKRGI